MQVGGWLTRMWEEWEVLCLSQVVGGALTHQDLHAHPWGKGSGTRGVSACSSILVSNTEGCSSRRLTSPGRPVSLLLGLRPVSDCP